MSFATSLETSIILKNVIHFRLMKISLWDFHMCLHYEVRLVVSLLCMKFSDFQYTISNTQREAIKTGLLTDCVLHRMIAA